MKGTSSRPGVRILRASTCGATNTPATYQRNSDRNARVWSRLAPAGRARIQVFDSLVFVQAGTQLIALLVDTVTEMFTGVRAAIAPVRTFDLRIARPNVVDELIDDDD